MLRKSLSTIYDVNKYEENNKKPKSYIYYTNFRKSFDIPIQKKYDYQINHIKTNSYTINNTNHKVHLNRIFNQLKDTINEMNNKSFGYNNNITNNNNMYINNNYQSKRIIPIRNYSNINEKTCTIINRTFHDLYHNSNNSFVEPINRHPYEERNEIEYFKLKKRYSSTPKRYIYQIENNIDENPFSYRNIRKKYDDEKKEESSFNESKSSSNLYINKNLNQEKNNNNQIEETKSFIPLKSKKIEEFKVKEANKFKDINGGNNRFIKEDFHLQKINKERNTNKSIRNKRDESPVKIKSNINKEHNGNLVDDDSSINLKDNNNYNNDFNYNQENQILKERLSVMEKERNEINLKIKEIIEENKKLLKDNEKNLKEKQLVEETLNIIKNENEEISKKLILKEKENEEILKNNSLKEKNNEEILKKLSLKEKENEEILKNNSIKEKENEEKIEKLMKNNEELKSVLNSKKISQIKENKDEINNLNIRIQKIKEENNLLNNKLKESKNNYEKKINEITQNFLKEKEESNNNLSNLINEIEGLKRDLNNEKILNKKYESKLKEKDNEINLLKQKNEDYKKEKKKDNELNNNLKTQIDELKKEIEQNNISIIKTENNLEDLKKIKENLENKIKENEIIIKKKDEELIELKKEMEVDNMKYENEINENKVEIEKLKIEKDEAINNYNYTNNTTKIINLTQQNLEQKNKIENLENEIIKLNKNNENIIKEKEEEIEKLKKLIIDLNNENKEINNYSSENIEEIETNNDFDAISKLLTLKKKFEILENENEKLYLSNQQLLNDIQTLNLKNKPINSDREGLEITVKNLKELVKEKEKENEIIDVKKEKNNNKSNYGKITYNDFLSLFNIAFENYKPIKKEQEDAFNKIKSHLFALSDNNEEKKEKKKNRFMEIFN